jgi:hypothetical protein
MGDDLVIQNLPPKPGTAHKNAGPRTANNLSEVPTY